MIHSIRTPRTVLVSRLLSAAFVFLFCFSSAAMAQSSNAGLYSDGAVDHDYREVTGLSKFARIAYRNRWVDVDAGNVLMELANFKGAPNSPALRDSWHDMMLSDFSGLKFRKSEQQTKLMAERIRILNALGFFDEAVRLYQQASIQKPVPAVLAREGVNALAQTGSADGACLEVTMVTKNVTSDEWAQDEALCSQYFGNKSRADELYKQVSETAGSGFRAVYKMLGNRSSNAIQVNIPPLWRTLLLANGATVTSAVLKQADAETLGSLTSNSKIPLSIRLAAASRGASAGTVGGDRLRALYEEAYPEDNGLSGVVATARANGDQSIQAYYAAARFTFEGNDRANIVKNAMHKASPITSVKNQVFNWIVDKLTLQVTKLGWFAPEGYSLMTQTNRVDSANMYYKAGNLQNTPFALIHALVSSQPWAQEDRAAWEKGMQSFYKGKADQKISDFIALATAYDLEEKLQLNGPPAEKQNLNIDKRSILYQSTENGGRGLTLIAALNALGQSKKLSSVQTSEFIDIIGVMSKEGLFIERKKITLEFLIQNML